MSTQQYVLEAIRQWVWAGYYSPQDVQDMIDDIIEDDCDEAALRDAVDPEFARKRTAERDWPAVTDCDRLDSVFHGLHEQGICALGNAGYTMSDGNSDVAEVVADAPAGHYHGFCFYHGQDIERAIRAEGLMLAFGSLSDEEGPAIVVGQKVVAALTEAGFTVVWEGTIAIRIGLPEFDWKRRAPPNFED